MDSHRRLACCLVLCGAASLGIAAPAMGATFSRPDDPVILSGVQTAGLQGATPGQIVAFAWNGAWKQIPVQVDERAVIDLRAAYPAGFACGGGGSCYSPFSKPGQLKYTDPNSLVGPDPDPLLDDNDEIVFMAKDAGTAAGSVPGPTGVVAGSGRRITVADPITGTAGYVYLFRQNGALDPGAGAQYVRYAFSPTRGAFPATYGFGGGPNPETSTVTTPAYGRSFTDRWQESGLDITQGGASGVDILDRNEAQFAPTFCGRSALTFSLGEGTFLVNKSGPVRAIRSFMGANSGPMTEKQQIFYATREDDTVFLRVHPIPSVISFLDYSSLASGMMYRNNNNPGGVTIDGVPDTPVAGPLTWESVDGSQGALTSVHTVDSTVDPAKFTSFYADQAVASPAPCEGDAGLYGASGPWVNGSINDTNGTTERLNTTRTMFFDAPGQSNGPVRATQVARPLVASSGPALFVASKPKPTPKPSRTFSYTAARHRGVRITLTLTLPGPGRLKASAATKVKRHTLIYVTRHLTARAGRKQFTLTPGRKLTSALKKSHHRRVAVRVTFTPTGGDPATRKAAITVRGSLKH